MSDILILDLGSTIKGNSTMDAYVDKIIVNSYSLSVALPMSMDIANSERTAGRPMFSEVSFSKMSDVSTTEMYQACTQGTKIGPATLYVGRVENGKYMALFKYVFDDAMISNISTSGGGGIPSDSFSINFSKITLDFTQQKKDSTEKGTASFNWDLSTNKAS